MRGEVRCVGSPLTHPSVQISRTRRRPDHPRFIGILSGLVGTAKYCCFSDSIENAYTAILERVFYHATPDGFARPVVPLREVVFKKLSGFAALYLRHVVRTVPVDLRVYPEENYRGRKLRLYQKARDNVLGRTIRGNFGRLKSFIKHEKILMKNKRLVPRVIQPRSPEYNVCVGRYIRQLEHRVYTIINRLWRGPTVMKGLNCIQQAAAISGAWSQFSHPVAIMLDAVRFDQHVSVPMLQWEHNVYLQHFFPCYRKELKTLLNMQCSNKGVIHCPDGKITYQVDGCRASGDMNTAMGNVLIMCATMFSFVEDLGIKARLINNGDDCCLIVEERDLSLVTDGITKYYAELGFIIDIEGVAREIEHIVFCQTRPVFDGKRYVLVRDPRVAISKDCTVLRKWSPKEYRAYLHELGVAGLAAYGNMPVWGKFYECLERCIPKSEISVGLRQHVRAPIVDSGLGRLSEGVRVDRSVSWQARASFAMAFGLTPASQVCLEQYYDKCHVGSSRLFDVPAVSRLF